MKVWHNYSPMGCLTITTFPLMNPYSKTEECGVSVYLMVFG